MEKYISDARTGLQYELVGDYYLIAGEDDSSEHEIGVWGQRRKQFLKDHQHGIYEGLFLAGKLFEHLAEVDQQAGAMFSQLVDQMAATQGITEALKSADQMAWVGAMNNIHAAAREIVEKEMIFV